MTLCITAHGDVKVGAHCTTDDDQRSKPIKGVAQVSPCCNEVSVEHSEVKANG